MKKRFSEEQVIKVLKEHEAGAQVAELCRGHGILVATLYKWKAKYGGMDVATKAVNGSNLMNIKSFFTAGLIVLEAEAAHL